MINDKERQVITELSATVAATPSLDPKIVTSMQSAVTAFLAGSGVNKLDLALVKSDFAAIASVLKLLK